MIASHADTLYIDVYDKELVSAIHLGSAVIDLKPNSKFLTSAYNAHAAARKQKSGGDKSGQNEVDLDVEWCENVIVPLVNKRGEKLDDCELHIIIHFQPLTVLQYLEHQSYSMYSGMISSLKHKM